MSKKVKKEAKLVVTKEVKKSKCPVPASIRKEFVNAITNPLNIAIAFIIAMTIENCFYH